jgi:FkbM family methyltransferase
VLRTLRSSRLPAPAHVKEVEGLVDGEVFVLVRPDVCESAKELYWGSGRRTNPADELALRLFTTLARSADVALDIGSYTGIFTVASAVANPRLRIHAFEVVPEVYEVLFENCVRNDVLHQVTLHHTGIGMPDRIAVFPAASGGSALPSFYSTRTTFDSGVRVRFQSLDSLAPLVDRGSKMVVKVDVEGTEDEVFAQGQRLLAEFTPDIVCEVLKGVSDIRTLEQILGHYGYRYYLIRDSELTAEDAIDPHPKFRDWFFTVRGPDEMSGLPGLA